ncbi:MAG: DOPA 4,5-dioxygenase family protein [Myxococcota bacterium]|nr:DOPA 4,5-dioxygenase family protein [Myxococcota bacterium]
MGDAKKYHIHVYFTDASASHAHGLYEHIKSQGNDTLGRFHLRPVGPHPCRQFNFTVTHDELPATCTWLDEVRKELDVLIHPLIDDDYLAHTVYARWLGHAHPLRLDKL